MKEELKQVLPVREIENIADIEDHSRMYHCGRGKEPGRWGESVEMGVDALVRFVDSAHW